MSVGRRDFIVGTLGTAAATQLLGGCGDDGGDKGIAQLPVEAKLFTHGVASGDPLSGAVILWTRALSADAQPIMVEWVIAKDVALENEVQRGVETASAASDFTVKRDVTGLEPGTTYYYAFFISGRGRTVIGRTRTLPVVAERARVAFTSCANYQNGYFNAYRALAKRTDLDLWIHLGDYIYEYKAAEYADPKLAATRSHLPANEAVTLADYRGRYAQYRSDPDLQEVHRQHPLIAIWDDHEFANNAYTDGAENHTDGAEGSWADRKRAGATAFLEWLPIRVNFSEPFPQIFRSFQYGDLFDLIMLDTRMWARSKQAGDDQNFGGANVGTPAQWTDAARHIVGDQQNSWFLAQLDASKARAAHWRLVGNQVMFSQGRDPLDATHMPPYILFSDFWDGYQVERNKVIDHLAANGIQNTVFLTGDIHSSWALEISKDPFDKAVYDPAAGKNALAIELVGPSITSVALEETATAAVAPDLIKAPNPHLLWSEYTRKGYVLIDLDATRLQAEWWFINDFKTPNAPAETVAKMFTCQSNAARLVETTTPTAAKVGAPAPAPIG
jgi:alkaline phosphatase D